MTRRLALVVVVAACALPSRADAHGRTVSHSRWQVDGDAVRVRLELSRLDHSALGGADPAAVAGSMTLSRGDLPCVVVDGSARALAPSPITRGVEWELSCSGAGSSYALASRLLFDALAGHVHLVRFEPGTGDAIERWLSSARRTATFTPAAAPGSPLAAAVDTIGVGARHVLGGADHLVFLVCLILCARRLREVAVVVTGFTVGHSVTLALSALGLAVPEPAAVEALIGLSIALVAIENLRLLDQHRGWSAHVAVAALLVAAVIGGAVPRLALIGCALFVACYFPMLARAARPARLRVIVAVLFGTVHGFGFASAVPAEAHSGLAPLFGFNLGVELGQLAVVALVWPMWLWVRRAGSAVAATRVASGAAFAAGLMWFLVRH